jgi:hypothetical protein
MRSHPVSVGALLAALASSSAATAASDEVVVQLAEALGQHDVDRSKLDEDGWGAIRSCAETVRRVDEALEAEQAPRRRGQLTSMRLKAVDCSKTSQRLTAEGNALAGACGDVMDALAAGDRKPVTLRATSTCLKKISAFGAQAKAHRKVIEAQAEAVQNEFDPVLRFCMKAVGRLQEACFAGARDGDFSQPELSYMKKACELHAAQTLEACRPGPVLTFSNACHEATTYGSTLSRLVELARPEVVKRMSMDQGSRWDSREGHPSNGVAAGGRS